MTQEPERGRVLSADACYGECAGEHRPAPTRRWCHDCSEWCYPEALCVRGENAQYRTLIGELVGALEQLWQWSAGEVPADSALGQKVATALARAKDVLS